MDDKFKGQSKEDVLRYVEEQEAIRKIRLAAALRNLIPGDKS